MSDVGESYKVIKISGKVYKPNIYVRFTSNISYFINTVIMENQTFNINCESTKDTPWKLSPIKTGVFFCRSSGLDTFFLE